AADGGTLVDLMCGSGTLPIEAALMASDSAPGLLRTYFGFLYWRQHDDAMWQRLVTEAIQRREAGIAHLPPIRGYDADPRAVRIAQDNLRRAEFDEHIEIAQRALVDSIAETTKPGLVIANPPYGERLGEADELPALYGALGNAM